MGLHETPLVAELGLHWVIRFTKVLLAGGFTNTCWTIFTWVGAGAGADSCKHIVAISVHEKNVRIK